MCGICGMINKSIITRNEELLIEKMNFIQRHRGPDDEGTYSNQNVILGHRRLSIFDLSLAGHQPMVYMDKYVISFNGEIYNYLELKKELKEDGYEFASNTDTEVVMAAYDKWGIDCLHRFNGFWAFALLELQSMKLILSRDRFGVKPLYYNINSERILFASEIKAILADEAVRRIANENVVLDFLLNGVVGFSNETFFQGIYTIPAGHNMVIRSDLTYDLYNYYSVDFSVETNGKLTKKDVEAFRKKFDDSIKLRLRADVMVGSCLSGGLDSSSVVCHMSRMLSEKRMPKPQTFSACFDGFKYDEKQHIDSVLKETGAYGNFVYPSSKDFVHELPKLIYYQEEPFATASAYAGFCVMREAKEKGCVVLLDGQGADEILCGYRKSRIYYIKRLLAEKKVLQALREFLYSLSQLNTFGSKDLPKIWQALIGSETKANRNFLGPQIAKKELKYKYDKVDNFIYNDFYKVSLPSILKGVDRNSMAFSIEDRLPFLDYKFVEFVSQLPLSTKLYKGYSKYIMRAALFMPETVRNRKDKIGFATPDSKWIKENKGYFRNIFDKDSFRAKRFINNEKILSQWEDIISGKINIQIFRYICLEMWMEQFMVE